VNQTATTEQLQEALKLIASQRLAATSALQRWMQIPFHQATALLDELERQGWIGPADGSKSRDLYARYCEQCGRVGKRGFKNLIDPSITVCANKNACRKRWPKPVRDDA